MSTEPSPETQLPTCSIVYPTCGACHAEISHDGDSFYCDPCGLDYGDGADGNTATFRDEEDEPCLIEPPERNTDMGIDVRADNEAKLTNSTRYWPDGSVSRHTVINNFPCSLPEPHKGDHFHPHKVHFTYFDEDGIAL